MLLKTKQKQNKCIHAQVQGYQYRTVRANQCMTYLSVCRLDKKANSKLTIEELIAVVTMSYIVKISVGIHKTF